MRKYRDIDLKSYHTFGMEVHAEVMYAPVYDREIPAVLEEIGDADPIILGGGSNMLFLSEVKRPVIHPEIRDIRITGMDEESVLVRAGSGVVWDKMVEYAVDRGWGGLENLSKIPGSVGASAVQNIGAYGQEAGNLIEKVEYVDMRTRQFGSIAGADCRFGYRDSIFKHELSRVIITYVTYRLSKYPQLNLAYADLAKAAQEREASGKGKMFLSDVREMISSVRAAKLPDPEVIGNAGSFFKNPVISSADFERLRSAYPEVKFFDLGNGTYKIPAAWLIDQCGLKGYVSGKVGVYDRQPLVLVAREGACGEDVAGLSAFVQRSVRERFGVEITPEVIFVR